MEESNKFLMEPKLFFLYCDPFDVSWCIKMTAWSTTLDCLNNFCYSVSFLASTHLDKSPEGLIQKLILWRYSLR